MPIRIIAAAILWVLVVPAPSHSLSKESRPIDDRGDEWNAGASCAVRYYNTCTGWVWLWHFDDEERFGVVVTPCCGGNESAALIQSTLFVMSGPPPGRGYTGSIAMYAADASQCPSGPALASQPYLPGHSENQIVNWGGVPVPNPFVVVVRVNAPAPSPAIFGSDHPAAGATGPQACGLCFPADRVIRSFQYGTPTIPLCPGEAFNDGVCDAELIWNFAFNCATNVDDSSWSKIKTLYR